MASKKMPPPENLPTNEQDQGESGQAPVNNKSSHQAKTEPASQAGQSASDEIKSKPEESVEAPPGTGNPLSGKVAPTEITSRAVWLGLSLFVLGVVLGGAVGWLLLNPAPPEPGTPVVQEPTAPTSPNDNGSGSQEPSVPQLTPAQERDQQRIQDLADLRLALELYRQENGQFPVSEEVSKSTAGSEYVLSVLSQQGIIESIPQDPLAQERGFYYGYQSQDGSGYRLTAVAESPDTPCRQIREDLCIIEYSPEGLLNQADQSSASDEAGITNNE